MSDLPETIEKECILIMCRISIRDGVETVRNKAIQSLERLEADIKRKYIKNNGGKKNEYR